MAAKGDMGRAEAVEIAAKWLKRAEETDDYSESYRCARIAELYLRMFEIEVQQMHVQALVCLSRRIEQ